MKNNERDRFVTGGWMQGRLGRGLLTQEEASHGISPGARIGAFEVCEQIGSGGMGAVFRASRVVGGFEQTVAIKLMLAGTDARHRERFRAEMDILAGLNHPCIAPLIDGGETQDGLLFLAMEYVDGVPLDAYCDSHALGARERIVLLLKVAEALAHAHRNLVIHRDIKPSNILVDRVAGRPRLLDFGIAKLLDEEQHVDLTQQGILPMTPTYAAPEQFRAQPVTVATDVYQFGVLIYRLISGGLPYDANTQDPIAWAQAVLEAQPLALDRARMRDLRADASTGTSRSRRRVQRDLDAIVQMALAKEPARRYRSMDALIADLEAFLDGRPVTARHGGAVYRITRFCVRHRWAVLASAFAFLALAVTTFVAVSQARDARREASRLRTSVDLLNSVFKAADVSTGSAGRRSLEDLLDVAARDVVQRMDGHPDLRAGVLLQVADAYTSMGLPARAAPLYRQAIDDFRVLPKPGPDFARALGRGAMAYYWNGHFDEAGEWLDEATRLATGADDESVALRDDLLRLRWQIQRFQGRSRESLDTAQEAVVNANTASAAIRDTLLYGALVSRGTSATDLSRYDEAGRDLIDAVELAKRLHGERHADTLKAQQALGWYYGQRGDYAKSLAIFEPIGKPVLEVFGAKSQQWARYQDNLAVIYAKLPERWEDAVQAYREAGAVYRDSSSLPVAIAELFGAATLLREHGRCREALPLLAEVEQAWTQLGKLGNPYFRKVYVDIAACELEQGEIGVARSRYAQAQAQYPPAERSGGPYAEVLEVGARVAAAEGDTAAAASQLQQAIALLGEDAQWAAQKKAWQHRLDSMSVRNAPATR